MCFLLILFWCSTLARRCGEANSLRNSRFCESYSRLGLLKFPFNLQREFARNVLDCLSIFGTKRQLLGRNRRNSRLNGNCRQFRLGRQLQAIADAEFRQDMGRAGRVGFELLPQPADEDAQILDLLGLRGTPDFAQ